MNQFEFEQSLIQKVEAHPVYVPVHHPMVLQEETTNDQTEGTTEEGSEEATESTKKEEENLTLVQ